MELDAFNKLVLAEMEAVYRLAYHLARHAQEADDLVQETYLRAFKSAAAYRDNERGVRPWLFKILHNVLNTRLAKEHRQRELIDDLQQQPAVEPTAEASVAELSKLDWDHVDARLKSAIADLPIPHRAVFLLCAVEDLGYREIADILDIPVGTVMSRLYRSRVMLAARLVDLAAEHGIRRKDVRRVEKLNDAS